MNQLSMIEPKAERPTMPLSEIKIGKRTRKDMGDIEGLAASIRDDGLIHPIVIRPDGRLIAGERRIKAWRLLGRSDIPYTILDIERVKRGEYAENFFRKAFSPSEMVDVADELRPELEKEAKARQQAGVGHDGSGGRGKRKNLGGNSPKVSGRALDHLAKIVGKDRKIIDRARKVCEAAKSDPGRYGALKEEMDRTGRVSPSFKAVVKLQKSRSGDWSDDQLARQAFAQEGKCVVANMREEDGREIDGALIAWAEAEDRLVRIDRRSDWGNPFVMPDDGELAEVVGKFSKFYLPYKPGLLARIPTLRGKVLTCWCHPEECHGHIIAEIVNREAAGEATSEQIADAIADVDA
jgi:hypothetical protein